LPHNFREIRELFVDLDGTIVDAKIRQYSIYKSCMNNMNCLSLEIEKYWKLKRQKTKIQELLAASDESADACLFLDLRSSMIKDSGLYELDELIPGVPDALESLSKNFRLKLLTARKNFEVTKQQLKKFLIDEYFEEIICCGQTNKEEVLLSSKNKTVLIGDTEHDIISAKKAGCLSVAVTSGIREAEVLKNYKPDYVFDSLVDFSFFV
jgi:pyrophosphatase PpaX